VRSQYHHCTDIVPTILEACGVEAPPVVDGVEQTPMPGHSMAYTFDAPDAPTTKETQYYELAGTRGIWHKGWKAVAEHGPIPIGLGNFDKDRWQLFHVDDDRSEAHDLAEQFPDKVEELKALWLEEAHKYGVLPLNDLSVPELVKLEYHLPVPVDGRYIYYPGTTEVQEQLAARTQQVSFKILADVDFTADTEGVIVAQGSRFGGYSLYVQDGKLSFVYNFLGIPPEQRVTTDAPTEGRHVVGVAFDKKEHGDHGEALGTLTLYVDDEAVDSAGIRTQLGRYALTGEGLSVGYDSGDTVTTAYPNRFEFTGGEIHQVVYDVADDHYIDVEKEFAAKLASD
jgi:arylsulfatase